MIKYITIISIFIFIITAFIIDELKIQELEDSIENQEIIIKNQNTLRSINDSLSFQCQTKDIIILKLKLINDGLNQPHN
jgi:hypothetical protein